ncbi:MAG: hypothetical protein HY292_11070 [Planctomycetes bacterium]|nr:hypothetical protein [Planctomycetota bacterium]
MTVLLWLMMALGIGDFADGVRAYREGRFQEALAAFSRAEKSAGDDASPELLHDKALAALRSDSLSVAEAAAEKAAARGGREFAALRDFLLGNAAFARCLKAAAVASRPEAEPFAFDPAIVYAETAKTFWQRAASSRPDWPEARRNVERALIQLGELKKKKSDAENKKKKNESQPNSPNPKNEPPPDAKEREQKKEEVETRAEAQKNELSPDQVARLLDRLGEKEREKLALRRSQRRATTTDVEKDW